MAPSRIMVEIIDFYRPEQNEKNLYITNIPRIIGKEEISDYLHDKFKTFGLIYEVQILDSAFPSVGAQDPGKSEPDLDCASNNSSLYAFVKFHSSRAAAAARSSLQGRLFLGSQHLKVRFANRKKSIVPKVLYYTKCYELANHYLGFNGWSLSVLSIKGGTNLNGKPSDFQSCSVTYECYVHLKIIQHGLQCAGFGTATLTYNPQDGASKGVAHCRSKKQAHQLAVEDAFGKLLLLVLDNGKVYAELNISTEESNEIPESNTLPVNILEGVESGDEGLDDILEAAGISNMLETETT